MTSFAQRLVAPLNAFIPARFRGDVPIVPVVRLNGVIGVSTPLRPGLTLAGLSKTLDRAFAVPRARAVALSINSPGGSPTQSHLIYRRIRQLAEEKKIPVFAFIEDAGASGGYMLACAADEIICDDYSIVGSIGVVGGGFGFPELMKKLGIERRIYTSGVSKSMLDPFKEEKPEDVARIKAIQSDIHAHFIELVKKRRAGKLKGDDATLFSGEFWIAEKAIDLGLADSRGELRTTLRARYGDKVKTPLIAEARGFLSRRLGMAAALSAPKGFADDVISALEERALWSHYGL